MSGTLENYRFGSIIYQSKNMAIQIDEYLYIFDCLFIPKDIKSVVIAIGRSSDLLLFRTPSHPEVTGQWQMNARYVNGAYSSGNCCRLSRHSLLIFSEKKIQIRTKCDTNVKFYF